ncbi:MAG: CRISPR-associated endonuclease Cas1 [Fervidicoccaceae archaeon]
MRLLVITGYGKRLSVEGKVFKVEDRNKSSSKVNPADIESIVIESSGVSITSAAIELASMAGIPIFIIRGRGSPTVISPIYSVKTAETRRKQYSATTGKSGCTLAKSLVRSKISNQAECLRNLNRYFNDEDVRKEVEKLRENSKRVQELQCSENWSSQLRQIESSAARAYWGSLAVFLPESIGFDGRDVDSGDAFNCSLNYIYALLYSSGGESLEASPHGGKRSCLGAGIQLRTSHQREASRRKTPEDFGLSYTSKRELWGKVLILLLQVSMLLFQPACRNFMTSFPIILYFLR